MKKLLIAAAVASGFASLPTAALAQAAATSPHTFTGNLTLVSDYRFRGISQTYKLPAVQGGFDYAHSSGLYLGTWASNVSGNQYPNGASMEWDFYGGYKFEVAKDVVLDVGALYYYYPGAKFLTASGDVKPNNLEIYFGGSAMGFSAKVYYALTNYFGLKEATRPVDRDGNPFGSGDSKGTMYFTGGWSGEVMPKLTLGANLGYTRVDGYSKLNYGDYKLGATYDLDGWLLGAALVGTFGMDSDAKYKGGFYTIGNGAGQIKELYNTTVVLSVGKTF